MRADKKVVLRLLKTARGQIDGIIKMVEEDKYCIDIVHQIMASEAVLRKTSKIVLQGHLSGCVSEALDGAPEEREEKINEIIDVFDKLNK
ncbi:Copper-sensing transcriptional repressor CsoR [Methanimicrococcus hongohii]|uniref:Copper-sensing transcriptional repressor CsoR n=1 Tax=Methanimicrococcus hongohii TaxID=3028295 RepID=A0AA96ZU57_9EURY|nr:metal-sensing transcriptional repressor [Methanimicrococcus sp. Hf6]WNY23931.1 Copper-sensing transcriptional repressor CsoR [Methanimicrococcus sp. Hf6]